VAALADRLLSLLAVIDTLDTSVSGGAMQVFVRGTDKTYGSLRDKIREMGFHLVIENQKSCYLCFELPKARSEFLYELAEMGAVIKYDLPEDWD
jgi:hypothetical protein